MLFCGPEQFNKVLVFIRTTESFRWLVSLKPQTSYLFYFCFRLLSFVQFVAGDRHYACVFLVDDTNSLQVLAKAFIVMTKTLTLLTYAVRLFHYLWENLVAHQNNTPWLTCFLPNSILLFKNHLYFQRFIILLLR